MHILKKTLLLAAAVSGFIATAHAQTKDSKHDLGSASNVWRIELRNLGPLEVTATGDPSSSGELHRVTVKLSSPDNQWHSVTQTAPFLGNSSGARAGLGNIEINRGDRVTLGGRSITAQSYHLWVHARERPQGDLGPTMLRFTVEVSARELDCKGQNRCRRGNSGSVSFTASVPLPRVRSNRCVAGNTYRITQISDRVQIVANGRPVRGQTQRSFPGAFSYRSTGPHLRMTTANLCIAATRL